MVDYDVMVFVRVKPTFCFYSTIEQVFREDEKALLIVPRRWYSDMRDHLIRFGENALITEIQLIKPKGVNYNEKTKTFSHNTLYQ